MSLDRFYPIGTPGEPWGEAERIAWRDSRTVHRSYHNEVSSRVAALAGPFEVVPYGALSVDPSRYPLLALINTEAGAQAPWALITGGVHGYETSGVQGALAFLADHAQDYTGRLNLLAAPCVSPWGYERIQRWNAQALDPNRSFTDPSPAEEAAALMALVAKTRAEQGARFLVHLDLHETTDSDENEFRPAVAARDGKAFSPGMIPDGFYTVADTENPQPQFQGAIIAGVEQVTHIAPADAQGEIIGSPVVQHGVIHYPFNELGLCASVSGAPFTTTTEVYPDSPRVTPETCNAAQVAAIRAAFDFALETL